MGKSEGTPADSLIEEIKKMQEENERILRELRGMGKDEGLNELGEYLLGNEAFKALPYLLEKDYNIKIEGRFKRCYLADRNQREVMVGVYGEGTRYGRKVVIIGEVKMRLSKKDVAAFVRKLRRFEGIYGEVFPLLIAHKSEPDAEDYARAKGIALYHSYEF